MNSGYDSCETQRVMRNCSARKEGGAGTFYKHVIKETHRQTYVLVAVSLYVDGGKSRAKISHTRIICIRD